MIIYNNFNYYLVTLAIPNDIAFLNVL